MIGKVCQRSGSGANGAPWFGFLQTTMFLLTLIVAVPPSESLIRLYHKLEACLLAYILYSG